MNRSLYSFSQKPTDLIQLIGFTTAIASPVPRPKGVKNGDTLIMAVGTRNSAFSITAGGWGVLLYADVLSNELNVILIREAFNEPSAYAYTGTGGGMQSVVLAAFRAPNFLAVRDMSHRTSPESAPALLGVKNGIYVGFAFDALSSAHVTSFTGLKTIGGIANTNTNSFMAYTETPEERVYGTYAASPTGAVNDGYAGITFK